MLTKFAELMWSGKGKLRRGEGCPRYNISSTLPQVVPRTQELTGSAVERCRVASLYLMWTKRGRAGVNWTRLRFHLFVQIRREGRLPLGRTLSRVTLGDSSQSAESFIRFFIGMYIV